jgi:hypothetical protein
MLIQQDGLTFVHCHPDKSDPQNDHNGRLTFLARFLKPGLYRVRLQFQRSDAGDDEQRQMHPGERRAISVLRFTLRLRCWGLGVQAFRCSGVRGAGIQAFRRFSMYE